MRVHRNAKTTPRTRRLLIERVTQLGWTQARTAAAAGVSVRTVAKWCARDRHGDATLLDGASRPRRQPRRIAPTVVSQIVQLRHTRATAWQISAALGMPRSTVTRVLQRAGLARLRALEPPREVLRYEWPHAGDLLHIDLKPLGRIRGVGHRITGTYQDRRQGAGWEYLHVAIDDATRLAYVEVLASQRSDASQAFLRRALTWYRRRGIRVRRLLTDNGANYRSKVFAQAARTWSVRHRFTRPYRPQTNGKAERFSQTLLREWAYRVPYASSALRTNALPRFVRYYNHQRPHASLGRRSPWTRFQAAR